MKQLISERRLGFAILVLLGALLLSPLASVSATDLSGAVATPSPGWGTAISIDEDIETEQPMYARSPEIKLNAEGKGAAVWTEFDGTHHVVWANGLAEASTPGSPARWRGKTLIQTSLGDAIFPIVAVNAEGDIMAAWIQSNESGPSVQVNRFDAQSHAWGAASAIASGDIMSSFYGLWLVMDSAGYATAVWTQSREVESLLVASRFDAEALRWDTPLNIGNATGAKAVEVDAGGNVFVMSRDSKGLQASRFDRQAESWETPLLVGSGVTAVPHIAVDRNGRAIALWSQERTGQLRTFSSWYIPGLGWGPVEEIGATEALTLPRISQVAFDGRGNAMAVGTAEGPLGEVKWAIHLLASESEWGEPVLIGTEGGLPGIRPRLAVDEKGYAIAVWPQWDGLEWRIFANRFNGQSGEWGWAAPISNRLNSNAWPQVAMDSEGNAVAVWTQLDSGRTRIFSNRFTADTAPPALLLTSPADESTVTEPTVIVAGTTERDVTLVINGVMASVGSHGSFSLPLALTNGTNVITATATDRAGNFAITSVRVTYLSTDPGLGNELADAQDALEAALRALASSDARVFLLFALQAAFVAGTAVLFAVYWISRKKGPGSLGRLAGRNRGNEPMRVRQGQRGRARDASFESQPPPIAPRRWPSRRQMAASPVRLTSQERILLHLLENHNDRDVRVAPVEASQGGIASLAGIDLRHFAQYMRPLIQDGLVRDRTAHVSGALHRQKVYTLTNQGREMAEGIRGRVLSTIISVKDASGVRDASLADVLDHMPPSQSLLTIVREVIENRTIDLEG